MSRHCALIRFEYAPREWLNVKNEMGACFTSVLPFVSRCILSRLMLERPPPSSHLRQGSARYLIQHMCTDYDFLSEVEFTRISAPCDTGWKQARTMWKCGLDQMKSTQIIIYARRRGQMQTSWRLRFAIDANIISSLGDLPLNVLWCKSCSWVFGLIEFSASQICNRFLQCRKRVSTWKQRCNSCISHCITSRRRYCITSYTLYIVCGRCVVSIEDPHKRHKQVRS